jgi:hypothetical protein
MKTYTDLTEVEDLVTLHLAPSLEPVLTDEEVALLIQTATSDDGSWTSAALNRIVSMGWQTKAGRALSEYDKLGGGPGVSLERSKLYDRCIAMAIAYAPGGGSSVDGDEDGNPSNEYGSFEIVMPFLTSDCYSEYSL